MSHVDPEKYGVETAAIWPVPNIDVRVQVTGAGSELVLVDIRAL